MKVERIDNVEVAVATIGIVSPGAMGSALGRAWVEGGARVVATVEGRSERTRSLAHGLELLPSLAAVVAASDIVVSVCPPAAAREVADSVLKAATHSGVFVDLNAISPPESVDLAHSFEATGWEFIDGSISGGPPPCSNERPTRIYLAGARAASLASLPAPKIIPIMVGTDPGVASAIKMCTASVYKGTKALWLQALTTATHFGVQDAVINDLASDFPEEAKELATTLALAASKSHRYIAEMANIAATQDSAGVGSELFTAMAEVYQRISATQLARLSPEQAEAIKDLQLVLNELRD